MGIVCMKGKYDDQSKWIHHPHRQEHISTQLKSHFSATPGKFTSGCLREAPIDHQTSDFRGAMWFLSLQWNSGLDFRLCGVAKGVMEV